MPMAEHLDEHEQRRLLAFARRTLEARVKGTEMPQAESGGVMELPRGAFVSIHRRSGDLRGCLGRLECDWPLGRVVAHLADVVAHEDPRFDAVRPEELDDLEIEISILTPEREVHDVGDIEVGRHGLIVEQGYRRGLLLPQVATEYGWDALTFVEHTCLKAGLPRDAWRRGARLFVFEAQVFGEKAMAESPAGSR